MRPKGLGDTVQQGRSLFFLRTQCSEGSWDRGDYIFISSRGVRRQNYILISEREERGRLLCLKDYLQFALQIIREKKQALTCKIEFQNELYPSTLRNFWILLRDTFYIWSLAGLINFGLEPDEGGNCSQSKCKGAFQPSQLPSLLKCKCIVGALSLLLNNVVLCAAVLWGNVSQVGGSSITSYPTQLLQNTSRNDPVPAFHSKLFPF